MPMPTQGPVRLLPLVALCLLAATSIGLGRDRPAGTAAGRAASTAPDQPQARHGLKPYVPGCPICDLWEIDGAIYLQAHQEVGALPDGVIYYYYSDNPVVIEQVIRFAYERQELEAALSTDLTLRRRLGQACGHAMQGSGAVQLRISTGVQGVFVILTSTGKIPVERLKKEASDAVRDNLLVRF